MQKAFLGYHSEWNMGSPGGWDYQRMAQEIGKLAWQTIQKHRHVAVLLDFDDPLLNPVPNFAELLLRASQRNFPGEKPFIALVAEQETLDKVGENIRFVAYLNSIPEVKAVLIDPTQLELHNGTIVVNGRKVTAIFIDFNNNVIVALHKKHRLDALMAAIKQGIVTNPRGMEPVGAKGIFEVITSEYGDKLSVTTMSRTPWTRQFYPRQTTGPAGGAIRDLVQWVEDNWEHIILKPVHGYSGHGIIIGHKEPDRKKGIQTALEAGDYIVQPLVPLALWAEEFPLLDREKQKLSIQRFQTDFRCFVTDVGPIGFVTRFGGIPTNVGSGGGVQSTAILRSAIPVSDAVAMVNEAILKIGYDIIADLQEQLDKKSLRIGNVYLLGPIKNTLRPRMITPAHLAQLKTYAGNLWHDALFLETAWLEGRLDKFVQISAEEEAIARLAPWKGKPGLIASDGLFGFV